ncbi:hypothetical protein CHS0354_008587 [Potamilus streckersoni]|uniref:SAFB-like transcription modulator n=1 Tax=Potamilus streckersoni TaxID=2493646 RepID=A0AAE0W3F7_9BIVA|nr:hypothetical protein CHS0354_008587 [Potamilus streckersoni]
MATEKKKLVDLRVIDLRAELEERGLDKTGVKAKLIERLQKALEDEGKDPNECLFEIGESGTPKRGSTAATPSGAKKSPRLKDKGEKEEKDEDEEEEEEETVIDEEEDEEEEDIAGDPQDEENQETFVELDDLVEDDLLGDKDENQGEETGKVAEDSAELVGLTEDQILDDDVEMIDLKPIEVEDESLTDIVGEPDNIEIGPNMEAEESTIADESAEDKPMEVEEQLVTDELEKQTESASTSRPTNAVAEDVKTKEKSEESPEVSKSAPESQATASADGGVKTIKESNTPTKIATTSSTDATKSNDPQASLPKAGDIADTSKNATQEVAEKPALEEAPKADCLTVGATVSMVTPVAKMDPENESLDVHVDDTQNDLDADLLNASKEQSNSVAATEERVDCQDTAVKEEEKEEKVCDEKKEVKTEVKPDEKPQTGVTKTDTKAAEKKLEPKKEEKDAKTTKSSTAKTEKTKDEKASGRNLWVSGLSASTRATDLKSLFSKYGKVVGAKVVTNARSPGSRCYGFVTMLTADEATKCIQHFHRTELHGKMISVERAKHEPGTPTSKSTPATKKAEDKKSPSSKKEEAKKEEKKDEKKDDKKDDKTDKKDEKEVKRDDKRDTRRRESRRDSRDIRRNSRGHSGGRRSVRGLSSTSSHRHTRGSSSHRHSRDRGRHTSGDKHRSVAMDKEKGPVVTVKGDVKEKPDEKKDKPVENDSTEKDKAKTETEEKPSASGADKEKIGEKDATSPSKKLDEKNPDKPSSRADSREKTSKDKDILSFDKIKEERERERLRQRERQLREEERKRKMEAIREHNRQREVQRKQRAEAIRLAKERDRLRREREQLEKERLEAQRLERLRLEQLERERIEREQEEKRRLEKLRLQEEQQRRALKRAFEMHESREYRGRESREQGGFWSEPKRAAASDRYDQPTNRIEPDNRGYNRDDRLSSRSSGVAKDNFERKVERYDRRDGRPIEADGNRRFERDRDSGPIRRESNSREHRVDDSFSDRSHDRSDRGGREMHEDRRDIVYRDSHRSRDGERRENISGHRQESDRRNIGRSNSPRHTDSRSEWKSERNSMQHGAQSSGIGQGEPRRDSRTSGSGIGISPGSRENWQVSRGGGHGSTQGPSDDRSHSKGGFSRNQAAGLLGTAPQSHNQPQWGSGAEQRKVENWNSRVESTSVNRGNDRWAGGNSIVQSDNRPITYQTAVAAPPGIIANVPAGMYVTTSMAPAGAIMMAGGGALQGGRQQEQRFDAYKSLPANIRRY